MKRHSFALSLAVATAAAACDLSPSSPLLPYLTVTPILDSLFVGDSLAPRAVTLYDENLNAKNPGPVTWTVNPDTIATVDAAGEIHGLRKGAAVLIAHAAGLTAPALVIVSRRLDLTLLMDTVYLMPRDTFTIPLAIKKKDPTALDTVWFDPSPNTAVYTIDTARGLVTAIATSGYIPYVAHVKTSTDGMADTGMVRVMQLTDTTGGRFYMTIVGTAIRHEGGPARAINYTQLNYTKQAFRLTDSLITDSTLYDKLYVTLLRSVTDTLTANIDPITPDETRLSGGQLDPFCNPPRPWGVWLTIPFRPTQNGIEALSHQRTDTSAHAGQLSITQYVPVPTGGGHAISGRYLFTAQRMDLYSDTLGLLTIRGTFVMPLVENDALCQQ